MKSLNALIEQMENSNKFDKLLENAPIIGVIM